MGAANCRTRSTVLAQQRKNEIHKMKQQVERGVHRDSINAEDYKKIISFREQNVEMNEYIQQDQVNKDIKSVI